MRLFQAVTCCVLSAAVMVTSSLAASLNTENVKRISTRFFNSPIYETTDMYGKMIRTVRNPIEAVSENSVIDHAALEDDLLALGVTEAEIELMTEEQYCDYINAEEITSITSYVKKESEEENAIYMTEAEASAVTTPEKRSYSDGVDVWKMTLVVLKYANKDYKLLFTVTWLTDPEADRGNDVIGISMSDITPEKKNASGWLRYTENTRESTGEIIQTTRTDYYDADDTELATEDNYMGRGLVVELPSSRTYDDQDGRPQYRYTDFVAHIEFTGAVTYPEDAHCFPVVGSYFHHNAKLDIVPEISIDMEPVKSNSVKRNADNRKKGENVSGAVNPLRGKGLAGFIAGMISVDMSAQEYYGPAALSYMIEYEPQIIDRT